MRLWSLGPGPDRVSTAGAGNMPDWAVDAGRRAGVRVGVCVGVDARVRALALPPGADQVQLWMGVRVLGAFAPVV